MTPLRFKRLHGGCPLTPEHQTTGPDAYGGPRYLTWPAVMTLAGYRQTELLRLAMVIDSALDRHGKAMLAVSEIEQAIGVRLDLGLLDTLAHVIPLAGLHRLCVSDVEYVQVDWGGPPSIPYGGRR